VPKQFLAHKNKKIWIATVNYQRIPKNFNFFENSQIVTGKNANKSKFKASGQTGLRENKGKFAYRISNFKRTKLFQSLVRPTICLNLLVLSLSYSV
jgi:hypothetical protein